MSERGLYQLFTGIVPPDEAESAVSSYSVIAIPEHETYFLGMDSAASPCLLIQTQETGEPPIRLASLDAQFGLLCRIRPRDGEPSEGRFSVLRCRDREDRTDRAFLALCETVMRVLGPSPCARDLAAVVLRLAAILKEVRSPATRSTVGLFGELLVLWCSTDKHAAVEAWRTDDTARFDFAAGSARLEVKASTGRMRAHTFSYDQCRPPDGVEAIVASVLAERISGGMSLRCMIADIEHEIADNVDLAFKLHQVVGTTLGGDANDVLDVAFDVASARSSLRLYDLRQVPALRDALPCGVSDVHFRSDLSGAQVLSAETIMQRDASFQGILPEGTTA